MKRLLCGVWLIVVAAGCSGTPSSQPAVSYPQPVEAAGLHNVYRLSERLYSGSSPEGDEGFASLQRLGIRTVLSVDGARPDIERAHQHGQRYVHLPIGYDGVPEEQGLRIARAVRDLPGPVYMHCHHGKHRGPAAAAVARLCLDEKCGVEDAVAWLKKAGTDPRYTGLYAAASQFRRPTAGELDRVSADFPETAEVTALAQFMVGIDERWDRMKAVREAKWNVPGSHPDVDPPHEALQLAEQYHEAGRLPAAAERSEEFRRWLTEAEENAKSLEATLRKKPADAPAAEQQFQRLAASCTQCHRKYRDVPQRP
jgi:protein tyrosine phosphatase (PTP) superfamily phosphohydrolase (DUF442 family)